MGSPNWTLENLNRKSAAGRATEARQKRCIESCRAWSERIAHGGDPDPSPLLGTAITAGYRYLQVVCPNCRIAGEIDLVTLDRHPETPIYGLVPSLACKSCPNAALMPKLKSLSPFSMRERAYR